MLIASALTLYVVAREWAGWLIEMLPFRLDLESNLDSAVVFFWLELLALVVGIRLYDELTQASRRKRRLARKFESTTNDLVSATERIWSERTAFAEKLDSSPLPSGSYGANLNQLNECLIDIRNDFLRKQLADYDLTDHTRLLADRVLRILDDMILTSFEIGLEVHQLHARLQENHERQASAKPGADETPDAGSDQNVSEPVRPLNGAETGMDELLGRLFDSLRPDRFGLENLTNVIAESYEQLGLGRAKTISRD